MSEKSEKRTVKDIDHTHPHTDEPFGTSGVYDRGTSSRPGDDRVPADPDDGGGTDRVPADSSGTVDGPEDRPGDDQEEGSAGDRTRRVKDLDHTPPDDVGAQRTFDRGEEAPVRRRTDDPGEDDDGV